MNIAIVGLTLSSSWGNGHATTWRSLVKGLRARAHEVSFHERREPWYEANRDLPPCDMLHFYRDVHELLRSREKELRDADLVIVGSYVRDCALLVDALSRGRNGVLAFYDIDTPVTVAALERSRCEYLAPEQLPAFDLYLSFSGGPVLDRLRVLGARRPLPFYCSVDPEVHAPAAVPNGIDLGYLGTWAADRQPGVERLLLTPAARWQEGRFAVAGPQYPDVAHWPANVRHVQHLPPEAHAAFYCSQRYTLNVTRADMRRMGYSPSVRLFEAACCGTPVISDSWEGLDTLFRDGEEILTAEDTDDVLRILRRADDDERTAIGAAARRRVLEDHTGERRAMELEDYLRQYG